MHPAKSDPMSEKDFQMKMGKSLRSIIPTVPSLACLMSSWQYRSDSGALRTLNNLENGSVSEDTGEDKPVAG